MAVLTDDPLYLKQTDLASRLLGLYDPDAEEQRRQKALGQMQDVIGTRYARAGETGSSVEKDALQNAAKDFSLGWAERQPEQYAKAITGSQLPISNLLTGGAQDIAAGGLTGYYGGAPTLARQTANENFNLNQEKLQWLKDQSTWDLWGGLLGSVGQKSGLWDWLFPGGTGYGGGGGGPGYGVTAGGVPSLVNWLTGQTSLPGAVGNVWDWITGGGSGIGSSVGVGSTLPSGATSTSAPGILGPSYDWLFPSAPAAAPAAGAGMGSGAASLFPAGMGIGEEAAGVTGSALLAKAAADVGLVAGPTMAELGLVGAEGATTGATLGAAGAASPWAAFALPAAMVAMSVFLIVQDYMGRGKEEEARQALIDYYKRTYAATPGSAQQAADLFINRATGGIATGAKFNPASGNWESPAGVPTPPQGLQRTALLDMGFLTENDIRTLQLSEQQAKEQNFWDTYGTR